MFSINQFPWGNLDRVRLMPFQKEILFNIEGRNTRFEELPGHLKLNNEKFEKLVDDIMESIGIPEKLLKVFSVDSCSSGDTSLFNLKG